MLELVLEVSWIKGEAQDSSELSRLHVSRLSRLQQIFPGSQLPDTRRFLVVISAMDLFRSGHDGRDLIHLNSGFLCRQDERVFHGCAENDDVGPV